MNEAKIRKQSLAILDANGLNWTQRGDHYSLRFSSAQLILGFAPLGAQTVVTLRAPVLRDVPFEGKEDSIRNKLNKLNCISHFGKWALYEDERLIALEYDLLGDDLQENELLTAMTMVARLADQQDDILQGAFGGNRSFE